MPALALSLELPDATGWRPAGGRDWVRLVHGNGDVGIELRRFRAEATVRARDCASRAGFSWPEQGDTEESAMRSDTGMVVAASATDDSVLLERRELDGRAGLRIEFAVLTKTPDQAGALSGRIEAAAAGFRVCVAARTQIRVQGQGREAELARKLALFSGRVVPSLALSGVEDRARGPSELDSAPR